MEVPPPERMGQENEIDRANKIGECGWRTGQAHGRTAQNRKNIFCGQIGGPRDTGVMPAERVEAMSIGSSNERFSETRGDFCRSTIRVEQSFVKMTDLNRVEAID